MSTPYQHTARASKGNAFCWDDGRTSIFCTAKDLREQARKLGHMSAKGQANVQASNERLNAIIAPPARAARKTARKIGAHHKGPRKNWATVKAAA